MSHSYVCQMWDPWRVLDRHRGTPPDFVKAWNDVAARAVRESRVAAKELSVDVLERIADTRNLECAWNQLSRSGGQAPGPDGLRYGDLGIDERWALLRALRFAILSGKYQPATPAPVRVPKGRGPDYRTIRLHNILDRVVQRATLQVLQPLLNPFFSRHSFGGRPGHSLFDALARLDVLITSRDCDVLIAEDFRDAFDCVPRKRLLDLLQRSICDRHTIGLVGRIINSIPGRSGVPQGSALSPLLLNTYLDHFLDRPWHRRHPDAPLLRYIDDLLIVCSRDDNSQQLYDDLLQLTRPTGMVLKDTSEAAIKRLGDGHKLTWLGFDLSVEAGGLAIRLPTGDDHWLTYLREGLIHCHRVPMSVRCCHAAIRGIINQAGPAWMFEDWDAAYRQIEDVAADCGFEEIPSHHTARRWRNRAIRSWKRLLARARAQGEAEARSGVGEANKTAETMACDLSMAAPF